jgi:hypothetical protein
MQTQQLISLQNQQLVAIHSQQLGQLSQLISVGGGSTTSNTDAAAIAQRDGFGWTSVPISTHQPQQLQQKTAVKYHENDAQSRVQQLEKERAQLQAALEKETRERREDMRKREREDMKAAFDREKRDIKAASPNKSSTTNKTAAGGAEARLVVSATIVPKTIGVPRQGRRGRRLSLSQVLLDSVDAEDVGMEVEALQRGSGSAEKKLKGKGGKEGKEAIAKEAPSNAHMPARERRLSLSTNLVIVNAVIKMQANLRRSQARKALMRYLQDHEDTCLAMAGTIQGQSGWYEFLSPDGTTMVVQYKVNEGGEWKRKMGPMRKHVYQEAFEFANERRRDRQQQRHKRRRSDEKKQAGATTTHVDAPNRGADSRTAERHAKKLDDCRRAETAGDELSAHTLSLGSNAKAMLAVVKLQSCLRRNQARNAVMLQLQGKMDTVLAMAGTVQGQSGWYEFITPDKQLMVVQYKVSSDGEWVRKKGPMRKQVYKEAFQLSNQRRLKQRQARKGTGKSGKFDNARSIKGKGARRGEKEAMSNMSNIETKPADGQSSSVINEPATALVSRAADAPMITAESNQGGGQQGRNATAVPHRANTKKAGGCACAIC